MSPDPGVLLVQSLTTARVLRRSMRKLHVAPLALALATSLVLAGCGSDSGGSSGDTDYKKKLTLGTGSTGGVYYPLGNELSTVLNKNVKQLSTN